MALLAAAVAVSGCGGSSVGQVLDPVARAASATSHTPGYRMRATVSVTTPQSTVHMTMAGAVDSARHAGSITERLQVLGHALTERALFRGSTFYVRVPDVPGAAVAMARLTGGKPWLRFDLSSVLGGMSLGSMPTGTDPAQFVDYLRAVSSRTQRLGTATIGGVPTIHYHVIVDLDRYARLAPAADRSSIRRGIALLESQIGSHTLPMDVWVDSDRMVRQFSFSISTCAAGQRSQMSMVGDLYDFAPQAVPAMPSASDSYDLTPLIDAEMGRVRTGCAATA